MYYETSKLHFKMSVNGLTQTEQNSSVIRAYDVTQRETGRWHLVACIQLGLRLPYKATKASYVIKSKLEDIPGQTDRSNGLQNQSSVC